MIIDISMPISKDTAIYPGDAGFSVERIKDFDRDEYILSKVTLGTHTGTHIDAPMHFLKGGKPIDKIPLETLCGKARVCEFKEDSIGEAELKGCDLKRGDILLLKTKNSEFAGKFREDFARLNFTGAEYLVERGIKAVGIDYLSVGSMRTHKKLLSNNMPIIEGLRLKGVKPGEYQLYCLPLSIKGVESAPARCVLITMDSEDFPEWKAATERSFAKVWEDEEDGLWESYLND